jgi:hypothetical protein
MYLSNKYNNLNKVIVIKNQEYVGHQSRKIALINNDDDGILFA